MADLERRGVSYSEAHQEAAGVAPITRATLYAYELWHPSMTEPIRFVDDKAELLATLEADAPRDAGIEVEFIACPLTAQRMEESDTAASPKINLARPDIGGLLRAAMDAARDSLEPWECIERVFSSDDTSRPAKLPPLTVELTSVQVAAGAGSFEAGFDDDDNEAIPAIKFTRAQYPGLTR